MNEPRPTSIITFKWLSLSSITLGLVSNITGWNHLIASMSRSESTTFILFVMAIVYGAALLLLWLIVWRRSNVARWIYVVIHGSDLAFAAFRPATSLYWGPFWAVLSLVQYACIAISLWMLFRRDARDWFAGRGPVDPRIFD